MVTTQQVLGLNNLCFNPSGEIPRQKAGCNNRKEKINFFFDLQGRGYKKP